jgi:hypothetical protein
MSAVLLFAGLVSLLIGVVSFSVGPIYGATFLIVGAILFVGFAIVDGLNHLRRQLASGITTKTKFRMSSQTHRQCPACRESVRIDALRCRYCAADLQPPKAEVVPTTNAPKVPVAAPPEHASVGR